MSNKKKLEPIKPPIRIGFLAFLGDMGGCGVIRTIQPYLLLNYYIPHKGISIHTNFLSQYVGDLNFYKNFSFVQFQRSATKQHLKIHREFKKKIQPHHKIPIIYEIDDLLGDEIPKWNFAHKYYKENIEHVEVMMREADAMIVSTYPLRKVYSKYNKNIKVIPNHLPKFIWGDIKPQHEVSKAGKVRILWSGSQNHFKHPTMKNAPNGGDFDNILMEFIKKTVNEYQWVFMGALPMELEDVRDKIEFHNWQNTFEYPQYLKKLKCDMGIAPLQKCLFNDCKSNIKALEFTALGIPGVYSSASPYNLMSTKCDTQEYMIDCIQKLANNVDIREELWWNDYTTLKEDLWWEEGNNMHKYVNTYLSLMGRRLP